MNISQRMENDLIEELNESMSIISSEIDELDMDLIEECDNSNVSIWDQVINCKQFDEIIKFDSYNNVIYVGQIPRIADIILGVDLVINKKKILDFETFYHQLLETEIAIHIANCNSVCNLKMPINIYMCNLINKKITNNENKIIIPIYGFYHIANQFKSKCGGLLQYLLCYSTISVELKSAIDIKKHIKMKISYKNMNMKKRTEEAYKNHLFLNIEAVSLNSQISYLHLIDNKLTPICLFLNLNKEINNVSIIIDDIIYEYNLLRGDAEELNIFGSQYAIINLGEKNIKHILKNVTDSDLKQYKNFDIKFEPKNDCIRYHLLGVNKMIIEKGRLSFIRSE